MDKDIAESLKKIVPGYEEPLRRNRDDTDTDESVMDEKNDENEDKKVNKRKFLKSVDTERDDQQSSGGDSRLSKSARRKKKKEKATTDREDKERKGEWYFDSDAPKTEQKSGTSSGSTNLG